jgi:hypothetical protein
MYFSAVASRRCDMQEPLEKLSGEPLSIDQLIEYLPALDVSDVSALLGTVRARGLSVANRHVSDLTKATSRVKVHTLKGTSFKAELDKTYREASGSPSVLRQRNSLTWAVLNWSKAIRLSRYKRKLDPAWMIAL